MVTLQSFANRFQSENDLSSGQLTSLLSTVVNVKIQLDNEVEIVTVRFTLPAEPFFHLLGVLEKD